MHNFINWTWTRGCQGRQGGEAVDCNSLFLEVCAQLGALKVRMDFKLVDDWFDFGSLHDCLHMWLGEVRDANAARKALFLAVLGGFPRRLENLFVSS